MKKILSNSMLIVLTIFPLMSLKSGGQVIPEKEILKRENDTIRKEIKLLNDQIKVVDDQLEYKDSIDAVNNSDTLIIK